MRRANGGVVLERDVDLTERQRQVLRLITEGKTNAEIGEALGISLDGAKWHVSEILSKLDVSTREEAAEYWRARNGLRSRTLRVLRSFVPGVGLLKVAGGVAVVAGVSAATIFVVVALRELGTSDDHAPAIASSTTAPPSATAAGTQPPRTITLDASPRPASSATIARLGLPPASTFQPWDGASTVIYDTKTDKETNLGPGSQPARFSPDSTKAVWVMGDNFADGTEAFLIDLPTGITRSLGPARVATFVDDGHVFIYRPGGNDSESIDLTSGARTQGAQNPLGNIPPLRTPDGYEIVRGDPQQATGSAPFQVMDQRTHQNVLSLDALDAVPAGPGEIAVASPLSGGQSNIYVIDVKTGTVTFVATAFAESGNWPFAANENYVMWTDSYCGNRQGQVNLFGRKTKQLVRLDYGTAADDRRWVTFTPSGLIAAGSFGAKYLIDPATMKYVSVIPSAGFGGGDVSWSPDYRYASHGRTGGHGGLCGG